MVGIGSADGRAALKGFVDRHRLDHFPNAADLDGSLRARLGVVGQPSWIFLDAGGRPEKVFGSLGRDQLRRRLEALAGGPA